MQQGLVNIPDNKLAFFIDLARNLGLTIEQKQQTDAVKKYGKASQLRGKISSMTNEQIDQQFNEMRSEAERF